ncbi:hypothetical protein Tco_0449626 [Tanacetum coccineum]
MVVVRYGGCRGGVAAVPGCGEGGEVMMVSASGVEVATREMVVRVACGGDGRSLAGGSGAAPEKDKEEKCVWLWL